MEFALSFPKGRLAAYVEVLTFSSGYAPKHHREKLIPEGATQIVVDLTDRPKRLYAGEITPVGVDFAKSWISGIQQRWIVIEAQQAASMLVIQFRPGAAQAIVRHDASALASSVHPLADVMGSTATSLRDRILAAPTIAQKFAATESWLLEHLETAPSLHPAARHLAERLMQPGQRVRDLAEQTGLSDRQVRSIFQSAIGVGPKQFARIHRFKSLLATLAQSGIDNAALEGEPLPSPDWASLASAFGYSDQSHMSHDFIAFAGMTPGAYTAAYRGLANYLPITLPSE